MGAICLLEVVKDKMKFRKGNWMGLEGFQGEFAKILRGFSEGSMRIFRNGF